MEVRVAQGHAPELQLLVRIGAALQSEGLTFDGVVAFGHGGPSGVSSGEPERRFVLSVADAPDFTGRCALAVACNTAPAFVKAMLENGVRVAAGYTDELYVPLLSLTDAEVRTLAGLVAGVAGSIELAEVERERACFLALGRATEALDDHPGFMLLHLVDQLHGLLRVVPP